MIILLTWDGPFGAGRFPDDAARLEDLMQPGVYLRVRQYAGGRTVSYIGQSRAVLARIDQHLSALLGLQYPLRDEKAVVRMAGDAAARLAAYNDVAEAAALAAAEAGRMTFYVAMCGVEFPDDRLNLVEGAVKARLESRVGPAGARAVENRQAIPADESGDVLTIESDLSRLGEGDRAVLADILGRAPIAVPLAMAGDVFDG